MRGVAACEGARFRPAHDQAVDAAIEPAFSRHEAADAEGAILEGRGRARSASDDSGRSAIDRQALRGAGTDVMGRRQNGGDRRGAGDRGVSEAYFRRRLQNWERRSPVGQ